MGDQVGEEAPFPLTDVDKWVLSQTDEEFKYHNWEELKDIIGEQQFVKSPSCPMGLTMSLLTLCLSY